jgi:hypothetical protein
MKDLGMERERERVNDRMEERMQGLLGRKIIKEICRFRRGKIWRRRGKRHVVKRPRKRRLMGKERSPSYY